MEANKVVCGKCFSAFYQHPVVVRCVGHCHLVNVDDFHPADDAPLECSHRTEQLLMNQLHEREAGKIPDDLVFRFR